MKKTISIMVVLILIISLTAVYAATPISRGVFPGTTILTTTLDQTFDTGYLVNGGSSYDIYFNENTNRLFIGFNDGVELSLIVPEVYTGYVNAFGQDWHATYVRNIPGETYGLLRLEQPGLSVEIVLEKNQAEGVEIYAGGNKIIVYKYYGGTHTLTFDGQEIVLDQVGVLTLRGDYISGGIAYPIKYTSDTKVLIVYRI